MTKGKFHNFYTGVTARYTAGLMAMDGPATREILINHQPMAELAVLTMRKLVKVGWIRLEMRSWHWDGIGRVGAALER